MADRYGRIQIFEETISLCNNHKQLREAVQASIRDQKVYFEQQVFPQICTRRIGQTQVLVSKKRSLEAARKYAKHEKTCVLNFASSVTPGGGVTRGAGSQEESICRISTLYPALSDSATAGAFYRQHWERIKSKNMGRENCDDCIFTPGVMVIREDTFDCKILEEKEWYQVDIITCAAPDLRYSPDDSNYHPDEEALFERLERRWKRILEISAYHRDEVLILGAFGCGVFRNPPKIVAKAACQALKQFDGVFKTIEFAIYSSSSADENFKAFQNVFYV